VITASREGPGEAILWAAAGTRLGLHDRSEREPMDGRGPRDAGPRWIRLSSGQEQLADFAPGWGAKWIQYPV